MKLNDSSALGWGTATLLAMGMAMEPAAKSADWWTLWLIVGAVGLAYRAGRERNRSALSEVLPGRSCSIVVKDGKLMGLRVDP